MSDAHLAHFKGHGRGPTFCFILHESIDFGHGTVESDDVELLMIGNVQEQILAHDGQTDEAKITTRSDPRRSADIDAGQTGATVSPDFSSTRFSMVGDIDDWYVHLYTSSSEQLIWWGGTSG